MARCYRILRSIRTSSGVRLVDVPHPLQPGTTGCFMNASSPEEALANLSRMGRAIRGLVAIPQEN